MKKVRKIVEYNICGLSAVLTFLAKEIKKLVRLAFYPSF